MKTKLFDDKLIVITGAAGFIGSCVASYLNEKGYANLLLVDDLRKGEKWKNLVHTCFNDMISRDEIFEFLKGRESEIEAFIHLGACSDTTEHDGDYFMENNYRFSVRLAEYALFHHHRFIYASSAATYGDGSLGFSDDETMLDKLCPLNLYGFSKHLFDRWIQQQGLLSKVVGLKYFNIFGPNEYHKQRMASMVLHLYHQIKRSGKACLFKSNDSDHYKDGEQVRDFYYVKDAVKKTCFFLDHDLNGIYNVGSGQTHTWNRMTEIIFETLGVKKEIEYIPIPEDLAGKYQNYTCADLKKFELELKKNHWTFQDDFTFESAIKEYVLTYLLKKGRW